MYEITIIDGEAYEAVIAPDYATMRGVVCERLKGVPILREDFTHINCERVSVWTAFGAQDWNIDASALFLINHGSGTSPANEYLLFGPVAVVKEVENVRA